MYCIYELKIRMYEAQRRYNEEHGRIDDEEEPTRTKKKIVNKEEEK